MRGLAVALAAGLYESFAGAVSVGVVLQESAGE